MADKPNAKGWGFEAWSWIAFTVFVVYPLSIGPARWLTGITGIGTIMFAYLPLEWLSQIWPDFRALVMWYLHFWS